MISKDVLLILVLYPYMSLFVIMEHPSLSQSSSTFAINDPGRLLTCLAILPRMLLLIRACYVVVLAMYSLMPCLIHGCMLSLSCHAL